MQCRKFFAARKPVFVYTAFFIAEERAGHAVHDHEPAAAFFEVFFVKFFARLAKVRGKITGFVIRDQYHQAFAAVAAIGAVDLRGNGVVEMQYHLIDLFAVVFFYKSPEPFVFCLACFRKRCDPFQVGFYMGSF